MSLKSDIKMASRYASEAYQTLVKTQEENEFHNYEYNGDKWLCKLSNSYGEYYDKFNPIVIQDEAFDAWVCARLLALGPKLISGNCPRAYYKIAITAIFKMLNHLIPNEEGMAQLRKEFDAMNIIDSTVKVGYRANNKRYGHGCIYGITYNDEILYIGKTTRALNVRITEHINAIKSGDNSRLYTELRSIGLENLKFEMLFEGHSLSDYEFENIEATFIKFLKPRLNTAGVQIEYIHKASCESYSELPYPDKLQKIVTEMKIMNRQLKVLLCEDDIEHDEGHNNEMQYIEYESKRRLN